MGHDREASPGPDPRQRLADLSDALATLTEHQANGRESFDVRVRMLLKTIARALHVRRVSLWRFEEARASIRCLDLYERDTDHHEAGTVLRRADYPAYFRALEHDRLVAAEDAHVDPRTREFRESYLEPLGIGAMLDVPLRHEDRTAGVLCIEHVGPSRAWSLAERNFALSAANVVATASAYEERRVALDRLAQGQSRLFSIVNTAHDAFIGINSDGVIAEWNAQAAATFGWSRDEAIGAALVETIIPSGYRDAHLAGLRRFHDSGDAPLVNRRLELSALHRDGHEFPIEITITQPLQDGQGFFFGAFIRDISERRRQEEELRRAKDAAEAATRAKTEFLANMSHELRTPLNGVLGYAQLLLRDPLTTESQREALDTISRCGSYLLELINDVLDLSRIEAGRVNHDPAPTDIRELLVDLERVVGPAAGRKGLLLTLEVDAAIPPVVMIDRRHLRQVLLNLCGNAIKFTTAGEIRVSMTRTDDERMLFEIVDTGSGIEPEHLGVIFEAFQQTKAGVSAGGTGLGLTISQRLVRTMGGLLEVDSAPGQGSRFFFSLPLVAAESAARTTPAAAVAADARLVPGVRVTALVADDNAVNRHILASLLESAGVHVITAAGGGEAVEHARRFQPDIIFMDRRMRDLDGLEATRRIRADGRTATIPVVAVSASTFTDSHEAARQAGCVDFIPKPVRAEVLYSMIHRHCGVAFVSTPPVTGRPGSTPAESTDAMALPANMAPLGRRLRAAAAIGDVAAIGALRNELAADPGMAPLGQRIAILHGAFDFEGLLRLADWLESQEAVGE